MNVRLHIERLVLDGLDLRVGDRAKLQAAVEAELARLLGEGGLAPGLLAGGAVPALRGGPLPMPGKGGAAGLGEGIAQSVFSGIGGSGGTGGGGK
jgi:hypothetical protein